MYRGLVPPANLHKYIENSKETPNKTLGLAILEAVPEARDEFFAGIAEGAETFPIIMGLTPVFGNPNELMDIWQTPFRTEGYSAATPEMLDFFRGLRLAAPIEKFTPVYTLPYSPLK